jgi:dienelactone hydrolase
MQRQHDSDAPGYAWRRVTQERIRRLLEADPLSRTDLTLTEWREIGSRRRELIRRSLAAIIERDRAAVTVTLLEASSAPVAEREGFRLERIVITATDGVQVGVDLFLPTTPGPYVPVICPCGHGPKWLPEHQIPPQVLARRGHAAALFDMPMFGEKRRGSDHFVQGAQLAMAGRWSNELFLIDALRAADYLESRDDVTFAHGMGVTGVSGGGIATQYLAVIDERVRAIAPACSTAPLGSYMIDGLYTGCPETILIGQAALGMDSDDLLCLAAPLPCLVHSGRKDNLFTPDVVAAAVEKARRIYRLEGAEERFDWYEEDVPHTYTATMAARTADWFDRALCGATLNRAAPAATSATIHEFASEVSLLSEAALDCGTTDTTATMLDLVRLETARLATARLGTGRREAAHRDTAKDAGGGRDDAATLVRAVLRIGDGDDRPLRVEEIAPASRWGAPGLRHRVVVTNDGIELPLVEVGCPGAAKGVLVCFPEGRPMEAIGQRSGLYGTRETIVSASIRGFGSLEPEPTDYDLYAWCSVDRAISDLMLLCGETALGRQSSDAIAVIEAIAAEDRSKEIFVVGTGEAALPALFASILHPAVNAVELRGMLASFSLLAEEQTPAFRRYSFVPDVLTAFDLPELVHRVAPLVVRIVDPVDARKRAVDDATAKRLYGASDDPTAAVSVRVAG